MADELLSRLFLTALPGFQLDRVLVEDAIVVTASSVHQESPCPLCGTFSSRVHSQYGRHLGDLPSGDRAVVLNLTVRRFVCAEPQCSRRIFCERFVDGPSPYARRTGRANRLVQHLSVILGGNAGAQLALKLPLPVSASTVLRSALALTVTPPPVPEIIGVDDFALRRGQVYGTVIVDLAQGKPIELLPDRSAETLAAWLKQQPQIKIISRDRSMKYEKGVRMGATTRSRNPITLRKKVRPGRSFSARVVPPVP